ncbi:MAG: septum site-determining protein MinC [Clostridia bacterium]|nr:septum site-determining protein MinC [Clostridia bacterium]
MSCININLKQDYSIIKISEEASQQEIIKSLSEKLPELKQLYQDEKTPIKITGKVLKNKEIEEVRKLIKEQMDVEVIFDMPQTLGLSGIVRAFQKDIDFSETKFYKESLRSGQKIEEEGSIVILGDVNSGAEVIASENIVVLGKLRGLAHAGAKGNQKAIISAGELDTVQIRISNIVKQLNRENSSQTMAYISIQNNDIIIEALR